MTADPSAPDFTHDAINLASPRLGGAAIYATDDFFADKSRMLADSAPVFIPDKYDDHGKWMDGWESRRRRDGGHDFCIVRLGVKGQIRGVEIDTSHFTGNFPPSASLEAAVTDDPLSTQTRWKEIVPVTKLAANAHRYAKVSDNGVYSHVRLHIYPDGGIARLRIYGEPVAQWDGMDRKAVYELSALANGGRVITYNDAHYGSVWTLLLPGRGMNMGDGWETRRRRVPGHDWIIVRFGAPGIVERIEVDTAHYKGNYPDRCSIDAILIDGSATAQQLTDSTAWRALLQEQKLSMDRIHRFEGGFISKVGPVSHVRLNIFPDGGVSRLRIFGKLA